MRRQSILLLAGVVLVGFLLLPFVALGDHEEPPTPRPGGTPPGAPAVGLSLSPCALKMYDFYFPPNGSASDPIDWLAGWDETPLRRLDLRYWNTGQIVSQADYSKGLDFRSVTFAITPQLGLRIDYDFARLPAQLPGATIGGIFDLPNVSSGFRNAYTGDLEWDRGIQVRWGGPGRWDVLGGEYTRERPIAGATVQESGTRVTVTVPVRAVQELGLATPGVLALFGSYGPAPERVYDKIPEAGGIQLGLTGQLNWRDVLKVDVNNDRRDDYGFGNVTGGDAIQGITWDRNLNGRIDFLAGEGPVLFKLGAGYMDFARPQRTEQGRAAILRLESPALTYGVRLEDRNSDGDFTDEGENQGAFVPKFSAVWKF